ncbi:MAG: glycine cleavage system protein H [Thermoanaerobaculum sp.]|nr:glycine cleavage system protein H [Thermoanaerobaculum sp.]MDW7968226.1 glycine cleavage system protein H [Thermoanaerobaculum sp.]
MTAILVILTILLAVAVDVALVALRRRRAAPPQPALQPMAEPRVPPAVFLAPSHAWAHLATDGTVRLGADDFLCQLVGTVEAVKAPPPGTRVARGEPLFTLCVGSKEVAVPAPFPGEVVAVNPLVVDKPYLAGRDPYGVGWIVSLWTRDLTQALQSLHIGAQATGFLRREMERLHEFLTQRWTPHQAAVLADGGMPLRGCLQSLDEASFADFCRTFIQRQEV